MPLSKTYSAENGGFKNGNKGMRKLLQFCTFFWGGRERPVSFSEIEHSSGSHNIHILVENRQLTYHNIPW